ncbi:MAG: putative membrane protein, partial [Kiritimatiellia bacterium]
MGDSPLQRAATLDRLQFLRDRGALSAEQHRAGAWWVAGPPTASTWRRLLDVVALTLGAALIVAGVVYVLVWNWTELGRLTRILLALAPVIAAGGVAFWKGTDSLPGQVAASSGAVLVFAPLIAVGLAYPSGGELWSLLAIWTALCVPWAISARFAPAWFIVLGAADATI